MKYGSVCSGAGTCAKAFVPLGVRASWFCEINPAASAVLAHHWPDVPNLGDMTTLPARILAREVEAPDILMGGTPCQAFSIAGKRLSLDDLRGNLTLTFCEIAHAIDTVRAADGRPPLVIFWENVPGVLSTSDNAFGCFLGALAGSGAAIDPGDAGWSYAGMVSGPGRAAAWRVLDAQYFGVAQRRRRVFVVAGSGAFRPESVLFESEGVRRDSPPSREAGEGSSEAAVRCTVFGGGDTGGAIERSPALTAHAGRNDFESEALCVTSDVTHALKAEGADASEDGMGRGTTIISFPWQQGGTMGMPIDRNISVTLNKSQTHAIAVLCKDRGADAGPVSPALRAMVPAGANPPAIAFGCDLSQKAGGQGFAAELVPTIASGTHPGHGTHAVISQTVRRLTPRECERLQGWHDDHTLVPYRGKPMQDGPRYKIIGNGWALPCVAWLGRRIVRECDRVGHIVTAGVTPPVKPEPLAPIPSTPSPTPTIAAP